MWNLNEFNQSSETEEILNILHDTMEAYDIIVLIEVMPNNPVKQLAQKLGMGHSINLMKKPYHAAVLFKADKVQLKEAKTVYIQKSNLFRPPVLYVFQAGKWQFGILAVHLKSGMETNSIRI